ncbi:amino acid permease, partial [Salmonella enterica]|uniref:amino acid permease n=1 Tax=Salmonella enterica TaxID=28901 RepID=UPI0004374C40
NDDVGRATLLAVLAALGIYLLVTLLSLGVLARPELAEMRNPSMAGLMVKMMGPWGEIIIAAAITADAPWHLVIETHHPVRRLDCLLATQPTMLFDYQHGHIRCTGAFHLQEHS